MHRKAHSSEAAGLDGCGGYGYAVVIRKNILPGCVATGPTVESVEAHIREAIRFHIEGLEEDGLPVPAPTSLAEYVDA